VTTAFVFGVAAGCGGLGLQAANVMSSLSRNGELHAFGPGRADRWPLPLDVPHPLWHAPARSRYRLARLTPYRWAAGALRHRADRNMARVAARGLDAVRPDLVYAFSQVARESLAWARLRGVATVLESPNGHIRSFRETYAREQARWCSGRYRGHPSIRMVERVEAEYLLADRIRVSSEWARRSLMGGGVPEGKLHVLQQPVNLERFRPPAGREREFGPLRVCFVGSLDLRKGYVYLLRALRRAGAERFRLEIVGATGDRSNRRLFAAERVGLAVDAAPGDPLPAYHRADLFVLPTLEDGSPFAVAEAMACGLPVIVTESCGAAEWVQPGTTGWVVPPADSDALAAALEGALSRRSELADMGRAARADTEARAGLHCLDALARWVTAT